MNTYYAKGFGVYRLLAGEARIKLIFKCRSCSEAEAEADKLNEIARGGLPRLANS